MKLLNHYAFALVFPISSWLDNMMNFRYFGLLILFVLNFSATVFADSTHFELPMTSHECSQNDTQDQDHENDDHHCCHQNHVHYYLLPMTSISESAYSTLYSFPDCLDHFTSNYSDIIKPPLV